MNQQIADDLRDKFKQLTSIEVSATYMSKGKTHKPTKLEKGQQGVYVFLNERACFKVGKAGARSQARWNSHHYNLDDTTKSSMTKSIIKHRDKLKTAFPVSKHNEIDNLKKDNIKQWIIDNMDRIEFISYFENDKFALNLLEALVQYKLKPIFEGR